MNRITNCAPHYCRRLWPLAPSLRSGSALVFAILLMVALAACGEDAPGPDAATDTPQPTEQSKPTATSQPAPATAPADTPQPTETETKGDAGMSAVGKLLSFASVSAGFAHTCGVKRDGSVECWGSNEVGGNPIGQATPPSGEFASVSAGFAHTCGVKRDGSVECWGSNQGFEGNLAGQATPPGGSFASVSAGVDHTCGVRTDGSVECWGSNEDGDGNPIGQATPLSGEFASVSAGWAHTCGVRTHGSVECWGYNEVIQATPSGGSFASVSAGVVHTCGVRTHGLVECWGSNEGWSFSGSGKVVGQATPPSGEFASVSAGWFHTCGVRTDGSVECWGDDSEGQATPPSGEFASVSAGVAHTCGVKTDGSVECWGNNEEGQVTGEAPPDEEPAPIPDSQTPDFQTLPPSDAPTISDAPPTLDDQPVILHPTPEPTGTATPPPTPTQTATSTDTPTSTATSSSARDRDGDGLIEVDNLAQLDAIRWDLEGDGISDNGDYAAAFSDADTGTMCSVASCAGYELTASLNFDTNGNGEADEGDVYWNSGKGWIPIGGSSDPFVATFEGGGHTISNLYISRSPNVGLFGVLGSGSAVSGIGLVDTTVAASGYGVAGALAGIAHGIIEDSFADGLVVGCVDNIGGLVGFNDGVIANSRSTGHVASARRSGGSSLGDLVNDLIDFPLFGSGRRTCYASGGGLVGKNSGTIASSHSTSVVSGFTDNFGGLAGVNSGAITDSYATGKVSGNGYADVGGLVGNNAFEGKIIISYATGSVSGKGDNFGGLAAVNSGVIAASYATGSVSGNGFADVGGLVGGNRYTGVITAAYAEGSVSGRADRYGGLLGLNRGTVTFCFSTGAVPQRGGGLLEKNGIDGTVANCYWDTETSGLSDSDGGSGKTTNELQSPTGYAGSYADWDVDLDGDGSRDDPWIFGSATDYPVLNLGTLEIDHSNLNPRPSLVPKLNAALCRAVNYADIEKVKAQITAGIDVNDTCQSETAWYHGVTPLVIAKRQGGPVIEKLLLQAGAVDADS